MKTQYASGRLQLEAPTITASSGGNIMGADSTFYFWSQACNRVGYNNPSDSTSVVIADNNKVTINALSFTTYNYEDWRYIIISVSDVDDYSTSRIIYRQDLYEADQITTLTLSDVELIEDYHVTGTTVATTNDFPTINVSEGYRVAVTGINMVFEYTTKTYTPDNLLIFPGVNNGSWLYVSSNALRETLATCNQELSEVAESDFMAAPLESMLTNPVPIKYYLVNDVGTNFSVGQIFLNEYSSNQSITPSFYIKTLGHLNLTDYTLDTAGITNVGVDVLYPNEPLQLDKPLLPNYAYVLEVTPDVITASSILKGTYISMYPLLAPYTLASNTEYWGDPVADIASLQALNPAQYRNGQTRLVTSLNKPYTYNSDSSAAHDGSLVIAPNGSPPTGRWLTASYSLGYGAVTVSNLANDVLALIDSELTTISMDINTTGTTTLDLDTLQSDYIVITTPPEDVGLNSTVLDVSATLSTNQTKAVILEVRQNTSLVELDSSFTFPGGSTPVFSGNGTTDLVLIWIVKDSTDTLRKRAIIVHYNIG